MGSAGAGGLVAHIVFWILIVVGWSELGVRGVIVFVVLWAMAFFGRSYVPYGPDLFGPYLAILDIVLVFLIFKGDVKLH
jgi:hypothetical protein